MLMLAGLFLPLYLNGQLALLEKEAAPHTERQKADTAKEKQEEKDDIADVSPEEIISKLDSDAQKTKSWFSRERDNLLNFLIGSAVSILAGVFLTWLFRRLTQNRIDRQKNLWRWEILNVLTTPKNVLPDEQDGRNRNRYFQCVPDHADRQVVERVVVPLRKLPDFPVHHGNQPENSPGDDQSDRRIEKTHIHVMQIPRQAFQNRKEKQEAGRENSQQNHRCGQHVEDLPSDWRSLWRRRIPSPTFSERLSLSQTARSGSATESKQAM